MLTGVYLRDITFSSFALECEASEHLLLLFFIVSISYSFLIQVFAMTQISVACIVYF